MIIDKTKVEFFENFALAFLIIAFLTFLYKGWKDLEFCKAKIFRIWLF